jgi:hypothetical protein
VKEGTEGRKTRRKNRGRNEGRKKKAVRWKKERRGGRKGVQGRIKEGRK